MLDKNGKEITSKGSVKFSSGMSVKVHKGDDGNLWIFIGSMLFPLKMWKSSQLEFIENNENI